MGSVFKTKGLKVQRKNLVLAGRYDASKWKEVWTRTIDPYFTDDMRWDKLKVHLDEYVVFFAETYGEKKWDELLNNFTVYLWKGCPEGKTFIKLFLSDGTIWHAGGPYDIEKVSPRFRDN